MSVLDYKKGNAQNELEYAPSFQHLPDKVFLIPLAVSDLLYYALATLQK